MSKIGISRVYWKDGAWRYKCNTRQAKLIGKSWLKLGVTEKEARTTYANWESRLFPRAGMAKLFDRYEADIIPGKPSEATRTSNYDELKRLRLVFAECEPEDITVHDVYAYLDKRGKQSPTQANHELSLLKHIFKYAQRWGIHEHNPAAPVEKIKVAPRDRYVTDDEFALFLKFTTPWVRHYAMFKYITGLRQRDILKLRLDQLQPDGIVMRASKTRKQFVIPWTDQLRRIEAWVKAQNKRQGPTLFCDRNGNAYNKDSFHTRWQWGMRKAMKEGGLRERFTEHDLRAKHATDAERLGINVSTNLQHSDQRTTEVYLRQKRVLSVTALAMGDGDFPITEAP